MPTSSRATSPAGRTTTATATEQPTDPLVRDWLLLGAEWIVAAAADLTELDARIGDGDHGINLRRGMTVVRDGVLAHDDGDPADLLGLAGRLLISSVGGASGVLYGTLFLEAGDALAASGETDPNVVLADALASGVAGVGRRGRSTVGQKTMLDTLVPGIATLRDALGAGAGIVEAAAQAAGAAAVGCESTRMMVAQRGRASYLGERAIGHLDPGAVSSRLLIEALAMSAAAQPPASTPSAASR